MALSKAEKTVKHISKYCSTCIHRGPHCWDCVVQNEKDRLTDVVIFGEYMAKQGLTPCGKPLKE